MTLDLPFIWTEAAQQQNFRALLLAMSRPGTVVPLQLQQQVPEQSVRAVLATLLDAEVTLADPDQLLEASLWPLLQARPAEPHSADFIVCRGDRAPQFQPRLGTLSDPQASATLIIKVDDLGQGEAGFSLQGPGVKDKLECVVNGLHPQWWHCRERWVAHFPLGVDCLLVNNGSVMALPRSSKLEMI